MSKHWPASRSHEEEPPASTEVSRLLVWGFLIAAALGLLTGIGWMVWNLVGRRVGG